VHPPIGGFSPPYLNRMFCGDAQGENVPIKPKTAEAALSELISTVYDAAQWPHVVRRTISYLDGVAGVLYFYNLTEHRCGFNCTVGDDPQFTGLYLAEYAWMNPLMAKIDGLPVGTCFAATRLLPHGGLKATPFFKEWADPQGYYDSVGAVLARDAGDTSALYVSRHRRQGAGNDETLRRLQLLAPHFRRALSIGGCLAFRETEAAIFTKIIDELHSAVMLVDATGKLLRANRAADALLTRADAFCIVQGRLSCPNVLVDRALQNAI
jgi:hypothetical protein